MPVVNGQYFTGAHLAQLRLGVQAVRVTCGAMLASTSQDVTVTWPVELADTNYSVVFSVEENLSGTIQGALARQVRTKTTTGCVIRISNGTFAFNAGEIILHATAIPD